eukprot:6671831-Prymnesium_polylepis.1
MGRPTRPYTQTSAVPHSPVDVPRDHTLNHSRSRTNRPLSRTDRPRSCAGRPFPGTTHPCSSTPRTTPWNAYPRQRSERPWPR